MRQITALLAIPLLAASASVLRSQELPTASAELTAADGRTVGRLELTQTPKQGVLVRLRVEGLDPGVHAFHIHETGRCETPGFTSAGGHHAPQGNEHGVLHEGGRHVGDLMNLHVPESGALEVEQVAPGASLREGERGTLFDEDGSALVIHAGRDDYRSQPSGDAGDRIACGVVRR